MTLPPPSDKSSAGQVTVVIMTWNRGGQRVKNLLESLEQQTVKPYEVIVVDTSSDDLIQETVQRYCLEFDAKYKHHFMTTLSKPLALNWGIRQAKTEFVMCTDIDIMFGQGFVAEVLRRLRLGNRLVLAQCGYLPALENYKQYSEDALAVLIDDRKLERKFSPGAIQATSLEWMRSVRGYDEYFIGLGGMDNDLIDRAGKDGLLIDWIDFDKVRCFHQWHEISPLKGQSSHMFLQNDSIVRNDENWGAL